jgi:signal transduction histidine kinase
MLTLVEVLNLLLALSVLAASASLAVLAWSHRDATQAMCWFALVGCLGFVLGISNLIGNVPDPGISLSPDAQMQLSLLLYAGIIASYFLAIYRLDIAILKPRAGKSLQSWPLLPGLLVVAGLILVLVKRDSGLAVDLLLVFIAVSLEVRRILPDGRTTTNRPDLAEQKQRELSRVLAELAQERKEKEAVRQDLLVAQRYKKDFLSNMSHELRTPLNAIIGYADLLRRGVYGELNVKQLDRVERILQNGHHLLDIVSDILDLSQLDTSKMYLQVEATKLDHLVRQVIDEHNEAFRAKALGIRVESEELPHVFGDPAQLSRVIGNLIDNAIKFTKEGEVVVRLKPIEVKSGKSEQLDLPAVGWLRDGHWVVMQVIDTGIGIEPEDQASIFDEFYQSDSDKARIRGGTGIGLAVVKKLVELHSGSIWLRSTPGRGSEFSIALPADVIQDDG